MSSNSPSPDGTHAILAGLVRYVLSYLINAIHQLLYAATGVHRPAYWRGDKT